MADINSAQSPTVSRRQVLGLFATAMAGLTFENAPATVEAAVDEAAGRKPRPVDLRCEYLTDPLGIDAVVPRLSWTIASSRRAERQTAYRVLVASTPEMLARGQGDLWDSGKVSTNQSVHVEYGGATLRSRTRCHWKVRIWDRDGKASEWSSPAFWSMGLLELSDWTARWIDGSPVSPPPAPETARLPLHIVRAVYKGISGNGALDVTSQLSAGIKDNSLHVVVSNETFGSDPAPNIRKRLHVHYMIGTEALETVVDEGSTLALPDDSVLPRLPYLRKGFTLAKPVEHATLYATALGLYEMHLNGRRVGDHILAPDWTDYRKRVRYQAYDVTALLKQGGNALGAMVANGWYSGHIGNGGFQAWGTEPALLAQLEVTYIDGSIECVVTDGSWKRRAGAIKSADFMLGESYDARHDIRHWDSFPEGSTSRPRGPSPQPLPEAGRGALGTTADSHTEDSDSPSPFQGEGWGGVALDSFPEGVMVLPFRCAPRQDSAGLDEAAWTPVTLRTGAPPALDAQVMEPVRVTQELPARSLREPQPGRWTFDLGQNMVGVVRLKLPLLPAGTKVTLHHGEMLDADGILYTANLRGAPSVDTYVCKGGGGEIWQPRFTFHGFRYVELTGVPERPPLDTVTGIVLGSDTPRTGDFSCSDPRVNQLFSNIRWGQRGNYLSVPTDCPQRDERMGWMGDAEVFVRTATCNADVGAFFTKWLIDVTDAQHPDGSFTDVSPSPYPSGPGAPAWADAGVICPWTIYQAYGDKRLLAHHLPSMIRWVEWCRVHSTGLIRDIGRGNDYGDWLAIGADTPHDLIGTAFFAYSTNLVAQACRAVGEVENAGKYDQLFAAIKSAFQQKYVTADGHVAGSTQCGYLLALSFDLLPNALRPAAARYLADDVRAHDWHLTTGFVGVGHLLPTLSSAGKTDVAYRLLLQDTFPSWLFSVKHGATTIWERWDGWTPEKGFQDPEMNSFNHYSLGSCGQWLYETVAGITVDPENPGFRHILIQPQPGGGLMHARARRHSMYGEIAAGWSISADRFHLDVTIPANTTATVTIPASVPHGITESGAPIEHASGVAFVRRDAGASVYEIGSGDYRFSSVWTA